MLPVIALVGRPNVGKSTLFNCLTRTRDALVANIPGLTRDRQYGLGKLGGHGYVVVDTGGLSGPETEIGALMERQARLAIQEADHVLFLLDAREGLCAADEAIARELRRTGKPLTPVVNKSDGLDPDLAASEFHRLGLGEPVPISAVHGRGVRTLIEEVLGAFPRDDLEQPETTEHPGTRVAVVGRPNVGKSTLINRLLGENRVLAYDQPGTTRDSLFIPFRRGEQDYTLIDTAGIRRRARVSEVIEKFSVIKALQAIAEAHVVVLVVDAQDGIGDHDASLAAHILESGRALVVAVNKWDGLTPEQRERIREAMQRRLGFLDFARWLFISALHGSGVGHLLDAVDQAHGNATRDIPTSLITRILGAAVLEHAPPLVQGRRIKLRYAHQGGRNPPIIVIHGNQTESVPDSYKRFLTHYFRQALKLDGTPIRLQFKTGDNPYKDKPQELTPRQQRKRQRLVKFVKRKS